MKNEKMKNLLEELSGWGDIDLVCDVREKWKASVRLKSFQPHKVIIFSGLSESPVTALENLRYKLNKL